MAPEQAASLSTLEQMVDRLEEYLDDERLFKTITVHTPSGERLVKLTLGAVLDRLGGLTRRARSPEERRRLAALAEQLEHLKARRPEAYYHKLARELKSYVDSWRWFIQSCEEGDRRCAQDYPFEVTTRLRIQRLLDEGAGHPEVEALRRPVDELDRRLRARWQPGPFVLKGEPSDQYPPERYWWLYGRPNAEGD